MQKFPSWAIAELVSPKYVAFREGLYLNRNKFCKLKFGGLSNSERQWVQTAPVMRTLNITRVSILTN